LTHWHKIDKVVINEWRFKALVSLLRLEIVNLMFFYLNK
jgi:hypothetical protein